MVVGAREGGTAVRRGWTRQASPLEFHAFIDRQPSLLFPPPGPLQAQLTYSHVVTALSFTPALWPPLQTHLMYSHVFTIGLCFLVARVMTPWQRVILHLDRWGWEGGEMGEMGQP